MKLELETKDIDAIAKAVAKAIGGKAAGKTKAPPADDDAGGEGEGDGGEDGGEAGEGGDDADFEGEGDGGGEEPDADAVKAALTALSKKHGQDTAMEVLKKVGGVSALSKLPAKKNAAVIEAANKRAKAAK